MIDKDKSTVRKPRNCQHRSIVARLTNPPVYECSHCGAKFDIPKLATRKGRLIAMSEDPRKALRRATVGMALSAIELILILALFLLQLRGALQ